MEEETVSSVVNVEGGGEGEGEGEEGGRGGGGGGGGREVQWLTLCQGCLVSPGPVYR